MSIWAPPRQSLNAKRAVTSVGVIVHAPPLQIRKSGPITQSGVRASTSCAHAPRYGFKRSGARSSAVWTGSEVESVAFGSTFSSAKAASARWAASSARMAASRASALVRLSCKARAREADSARRLAISSSSATRCAIREARSASASAKASDRAAAFSSVSCCSLVAVSMGSSPSSACVWDWLGAAASSSVVAVVSSSAVSSSQHPARARDATVSNKAVRRIEISVSISSGSASKRTATPYGCVNVASDMRKGVFLANLFVADGKLVKIE